MKKVTKGIAIFFLCYFFLHYSLFAESNEKLRVLVLTDIENEPDDAESLVRFLTYVNQWDIEGIIATTSYWQKDKVADWRINEILEGYKKVQPNLLKHEPGYPTYEFLKSKVKKGLPEYGMNGVGMGKDNEGSDWIIHVLEQDDDRPVWILVWGGANCLAQALWKVKETRSPAEVKKFVQKLRVYTISDQDDTGPWMRKTFPELFYIVSPGYEHDGAGGYHYATWAGISGDIFHGRFPGANREVISKEWLKKNIQTGHGPLGAEYPDVAYLMEGDSPSFLYLISNGLADPEHPDYGSWGGRYEFYTPRTRKWFFEAETRPFWSDTQDEVYSHIDQQNYTSNHATIWRWREAYQNDFAARMDWCVKDYDEANHPPAPKLDHSEYLTVYEGDRVEISAIGSTDPDQDQLFFEWMQYREVGSYKGWLQINNANNIKASFTAPGVSYPQTAHIILKVTDNGEPSLTRYERLIIEILPKHNK